mgnify:CR=1 FL=1
MKFISLILATITTFTSTTTTAALITFGNYTLDEELNIVRDTARNIEWLQWDVTNGSSIDSALAIYEPFGWKLASNLQMANLFDDFGLNSTTDENDFSFTESPYSATDGDDTGYDHIIRLFGSTFYEEGGIFGEGDDAYIYTSALFGSD